MTNIFKRSEQLADGAALPAAEAWAQLGFNSAGLIPVIAQCHSSRQVLMQAWANTEALQLSISSGRMHYYSRSRARIWRKGESSGHEQKLIELRADCDGDCLLALVQQSGVACHTLRSSCFYWLFKPEELILQPETVACGK